MHLFFTTSHSKAYSEKYGRFISFFCPQGKGFLYFCATFFKENDPQNGTSAYHLKTMKIIYHKTTKVTNHTTLDKSYGSTNKQQQVTFRHARYFCLQLLNLNNEPAKDCIKCSLTAKLQKSTSTSESTEREGRSIKLAVQPYSNKLHL